MTSADPIKPCRPLRVLVTGGAHGIGLGIAHAFARRSEWVMTTGATDDEGVILPVDGRDLTV